MRSTLRVVRPSGELVVNPETLQADRESVLVYEGRGKLQNYNAYEQKSTIAGESVTILRIRCDIPLGAAVVQPGDVVEVLANPDDPSLVGVKMRVAMQAPNKSIATAYRFWCDAEDQGGTS